MQRPQEAGAKPLYNQVPQTVWVSWSSRQAEFSLSCSHSSSSSCSWGQNAVVSVREWAWALRTPVEQPNRMRKKCCYHTEELGVNMWQSVPFPIHLSHITNINPFATLSRIKCERYIFLKKCVCSSLLLTMLPCIVVYILCGYTTGGRYSHFQDCSILPLILTLKCWVLSKVASSTIFWVFGMTQPVIEPQSPRPLANTLLIWHHWMIQCLGE